MGIFRTILWDIDDTLLDFGKSEDFALREAFRHFGMPVTDEIVRRYSEINLSFWKRLERGEVDKLTVLRERFVTLFKELGIDGADIEAFRGVYQTHLGSVYFWNENALELVKKLRGSCRQYAVTNGVSWTQRNKLKLSGLDKLLEDFFISEELGAAKPFPEFFEEVFRRIPDFCRENTILVGDSLTSDMKGAANSGITSCWYNPNKKTNDTKYKIDYTIESLWEMEKIIGL